MHHIGRKVQPLPISLGRWLRDPGGVKTRDFFKDFEAQISDNKEGVISKKRAAEMYSNALCCLTGLTGRNVLGVQSCILELIQQRSIHVTPKHVTSILNSHAVRSLSSTDQLAHARQLVALLPPHADTTDAALNEALLVLLSQLSKSKKVPAQAAAVYAAYTARGTDPTPKMVGALAAFACTPEGVFSCFAKLPKRGGGDAAKAGLPAAAELRTLCRECVRVGDAEAVVCIFQYALHVLEKPKDFVGFLAQVVDPATPPADVVSLWDHGKVYFSDVGGKTKFATQVCEALVALARGKPELAGEFKVALETVSGEVVALHTAEQKRTKAYAALQRQVRVLSPETADDSDLPHVKAKARVEEAAAANSTRKAKVKKSKVAVATPEEEDDSSD